MIQPEPKSKGQLDYNEQGYIVQWDEVGLQIQVTDYHAGPLRLFCSDILALAKVARAKDFPEERDQ